MKRLIADNTPNIEQFIKGVALDGREILKSLEQFKFKMEQCTNVSVNEDINDKIHQHYDMIDKLMSGLYSICYDLENINLIPQYDSEQINLSDQDAPDSDNDNYNLSEEIPLDETETGAGEENVDISEEDMDTDESEEEENVDFDMDEEENSSEESEEE